jgi:hypothetical protein
MLRTLGAGRQGPPQAGSARRMRARQRGDGTRRCAVDAGQHPPRRRPAPRARPPWARRRDTGTSGVMAVHPVQRSRRTSRERRHHVHPEHAHVHHENGHVHPAPRARRGSRARPQAGIGRGVPSVDGGTSTAASGTSSEPASDSGVPTKPSLKCARSRSMRAARRRPPSGARSRRRPAATSTDLPTGGVAADRGYAPSPAARSSAPPGAKRYSQRVDRDTPQGPGRRCASSSAITGSTSAPAGTEQLGAVVEGETASLGTDLRRRARPRGHVLRCDVRGAAVWYGLRVVATGDGEDDHGKAPSAKDSTTDGWVRHRKELLRSRGDAFSGGYAGDAQQARTYS